MPFEELKKYKEMLKKMTLSELRAEKKRVDANVGEIFRAYYGCIANAPSWDIAAYDLYTDKQYAIRNEGKRRIAEGLV